MNASRLAYIAIVIAAVLAAASQAEAQEMGRHPALRAATPAPVPTIDPNHFIVGHPAGGWQRAGHANFAHPAVTVSGQGVPAVDPNHFLVQPPSAVHWADGPAADLTLAAAR